MLRVLDGNNKKIKRMKYCKLLIILILVSCGSIDISSDYDSQTNFNAYKRFHFFEDAGKGLNELDVKRIHKSLTEGLQSIGLEKKDSPDFYINIVSEERVSEQRNTIGVGIGGGRNVGFGISGGIPIGGRKIHQQIVIDFVDAKSNQLIWQGVVSSEIKEKLTPKEKEIHYKKVVQKILEKYPPKKK